MEALSCPVLLGSLAGPAGGTKTGSVNRHNVVAWMYRPSQRCNNAYLKGVAPSLKGERSLQRGMLEQSDRRSSCWSTTTDDTWMLPACASFRARLRRCCSAAAGVIQAEETQALRFTARLATWLSAQRFTVLHAVRSLVLNCHPRHPCGDTMVIHGSEHAC